MCWVSNALCMAQQQGSEGELRSLQPGWRQGDPACGAGQPATLAWSWSSPNPTKPGKWERHGWHSASCHSLLCSPGGRAERRNKPAGFFSKFPLWITRAAWVRGLNEVLWALVFLSLSRRRHTTCTESIRVILTNNIVISKVLEKPCVLQKQMHLEVISLLRSLFMVPVLFHNSGQILLQTDDFKTVSMGRLTSLYPGLNPECTQQEPPFGISGPGLRVALHLRASVWGLLFFFSFKMASELLPPVTRLQSRWQPGLFLFTNLEIWLLANSVYQLYIPAEAQMSHFHVAHRK